MGNPTPPAAGGGSPAKQIPVGSPLPVSSTVVAEGQAITVRDKIKTDRHIDTSKQAVRAVIVYGLFAVLGLTIAAGITGALLPCDGGDLCPRWDRTKSLLDLLLPVETALLGAAVAFYMVDTGKD